MAQTKTKSQDANGTAIGNNTRVEINDDEIVIRINMGANSRDNAPTSSTGKSRLLASTGGWKHVPGTDLSLSLMVNFKD